MDEENLVRPSFGEKHSLGIFYEARSDTFVNSTILDSSMPENVIITEDTHYKVCKILTNDSWAARFSALEIPIDARLSLLSRIVNYDGIGKCFDTAQKKKAEGFKLWLIYQINTYTEYVDIFSDEIRPFILSDALNQCNATHIVAKTKWGSNTVVAIDVAAQNGIAPGDSSKNLESFLNDLGLMLTNDHFDAENSISNTSFEQIVITLNSDIYSDEKVFTTFAELENELKALPDLTSELNNGKGNLLSYEMIPLTTLVEKLNLNVTDISPFYSISEEITSQFVQMFDDILLLKTQVNDINTQLKQHELCISKADKESITMLEANLASIETMFQQDLARNVVKVRAGEADQSELEALLDELKNQRDSLENLVKKCQKDIERSKVKLAFMAILRSKNVSFICSTEDFDNLLLQDADRSTYLLIYNTTAALEDSQNWTSQLNTFINLIDLNKSGENVGFAYLDNDVLDNPELTAIAIHHVKGNATISRDVQAEVQTTSQLCLAFSPNIDPKIKKSTKRGNVRLKCPRSFRSHDPCSDETHLWQCKVCHDVLQYGFDGHFYCTCGGAPCTAYQFKCKDTSKHTLQYIGFRELEHLRAMVNEIQPYAELNIVILGETGVGKSTWINGFANYLTYDTLGMALGDEPLCLIPTSFTMRDKKKGKSVVIEMGGKSKNETGGKGQSSTQMPTSYIFFVNETRVCLIDTPGIGDTRGIEQDRINFENIMSHLAFFNQIHGICILLKPNSSRLSVMFQFCIQELLSHLHKDACRNIVFVFTNARNTFYSAGDTFPLLEALLEEKIKGAIRLDEKTEYYMDNESVRFLAAKRAGVEFADDEFDIYAKSWDKAVAENRRLMEYISTLPPHQISNTRSLNEARRMILELTKPLAEISNNIQDNILVIKRKKAEIEAMDKNKEDLFEKLYIPHIDLESHAIPYPRTVCTSKSCIDVFKGENGVEINDYKTWCHKHCRLRNVIVQQYPAPELQRCSVMDVHGKCEHCGCMWFSHMHITFATKQVTTKIIDKNVELKIKSESDAISAVSKFIQDADDRLKKFNEEQHKINATAAMFGNFLRSNAITPYNDATANYLSYEILIEEGLVGKGSGSMRLSCLRDLLDKYNKEVEILEESMKNGQQAKAFSSEKIQQLIEELYNLPISGKMLKDMMTVAGKANASMVEEHAVVLEGGSKKGKRTGKLGKAITVAKSWYDNMRNKFLPAAK